MLEALILTSGVVLSLTGYTFWASKKGKDFSYLGPVLFAGLVVLLLTSFIQVIGRFLSCCELNLKSIYRIFTFIILLTFIITF